MLVPRKFAPFLLKLAVFAGVFSLARAEDGYRLWLRYDPIDDTVLRANYAKAAAQVVIHPVSPTLQAARDELVEGLQGLLGQKIIISADAPSTASAVIVATPQTEPALAKSLAEELAEVGPEGYLLKTVASTGEGAHTVIAANSDIGALYGVFAFLRQLQTHQSIASLSIASQPRIQHRLLNHWDNLNRSIERGYAGQSLWEWFELPDYINPRYRDYARADASIGINGIAINNVNAEALILTAPYLKKVAALADVFRPYGIRVYLSARFSAPVELGGLPNADPLNPAVQKWWKDQADEIYRAVPDFGGFLVKANSEGQPGPQNYRRNHADGANLLADAVGSHGGIVMWRAFVYDQDVHTDRARQAYDEFKPLDGKFRSNVIVQIKNGPIDFMPREPLHPLFGALPKTPIALELQIAQEYLGCDIQLVYLATLFKEALDADTFTEGAGSTVAKVVDGSLDHHALTAIAGVANTGTDRDWTGHPLLQANWYAFGRLAWDHQLTPAQIADEWTRQTYSNDGDVVNKIVPMLLASREAVVDYSMPLGLHHIMARDHHYGPGPWTVGGRPDWTAPYYHKADPQGVGFDRTATGSNALSVYSPQIQKNWGDLATCPDNLLLWFHHVAWDYRMRSGRTLWDELCLHYQSGVDQVRGWQKTWGSLESSIDHERFLHVKQLLARQEHDAREYKDACLLYFQTFSHRPFAAGCEPAEHELAYYEAEQLHFVPGAAETNGR